MKILMIGGTGTISAEISKQLSKRDDELYLINRGNSNSYLDGYKINYITCDISDEKNVEHLLSGIEFDAVADFIAYKPKHIERDYRLFAKRTKQFIFISSASIYKKPSESYIIDENTSLSNPDWEYSMDKIACEERLLDYYNNYDFPVTIVRPSHTYDKRKIPVGVYGEKGSWQVAKRMLEGKQVIMHGDGTSLWTITNSKDFAKGFIGLIGNKRAIGEAVNITSDECISWNQIYQSLADALGGEYKPYYVPSDFIVKVGQKDYSGTLLGDKSNCVIVDNSKLKNLVPEYRPEISFEEGIKESVKYYLSHPELQVEDKEFDTWCDKVIAAMDSAVKELNG